MREGRRERRLADAGRPDHRHEHRQAAGDRPVPQGAEDRQLQPASDDALVSTGAPVTSAAEMAIQAGIGCSLPFATTGVLRLVPDDVARREVGLGADDDAVDRRGGLQAGRGVDHVTGDQRFAERCAGAEGDNRLPGVHSDAQLQTAFDEVAGDVTDGKRSAHCALRVVTMGERRAEDAHHRVADELLDSAAERLDLAPDALVVRPSSARTSSGSSSSARPVKPTGRRR